MTQIKTLTLDGKTYTVEDPQLLLKVETIQTEVAKTAKTVNGERYKYIDGKTCFGWASGAGTTWTGNTYELIIVPVNGGEVFEFAPAEGATGYLYFLKTYKKPVIGESPNFTSTTSLSYYDITSGVVRTINPSARCNTMSDHAARFTVPADTRYILVVKSNSAGALPPKYIKVNDSEYEVLATGLIDDVARLETKIDAVKNESQATAINVDNPYVRAYLVNTQYSTDEWDETNGRPYFTREDVSAYSQYIEGGKDKATPYIVNIEPYNGASGYKILVSENPLYTNAKQLRATIGENKITWLKINRMYWIKTIATTGNGEVVLTEKSIETRGTRRLNPLTSVQNMRDLGGQTTIDGSKLKQGLLYRSGRLMWITQEDVSLLENVLDIKLVVGLAAGTEDEDIFSVEKYNITEAGFSLPNGWDTLSAVETRQKYITYLRKIIEYISQGKPVLIHCNGGADRTGLMSAMIEGLCGVSENDICKDYELTSFGIESGTIQTGNPRMLSRTRLGSKNEDGTYTNTGFDSGIWYVRQQSGCETFADKWKKCLQSSALAVDGFEPLKDEEIEALRKALIAEK